MATVMENGGGFDGWDFEQLDGDASGVDNLSVDMDEFLGLLDEDSDPVPVKGSLESASLMEVLTDPSVPTDATPIFQHDKSIFEVLENGNHDSLLAASNREVEAHMNDQRHLLDINYSLLSPADSNRADVSVFEGLDNSLRSSFSPAADSEWLHILNDNGDGFPSNENGPTIDAIGFQPDFEFSTTDLVGASWKSSNQFLVENLPSRSSEITGAIYRPEIDFHMSTFDGIAPYANAPPVCKPLQSWNETGTMLAEDNLVNFPRLQFAKVIEEASAVKKSSLPAEKVIWSADSSSALSCISRDASKRGLNFSRNGEMSGVPELFKRARVAKEFESVLSVEDGFPQYDALKRCLADSRPPSISKMHPDICIIEEMSHPARLNSPVAVVNTHISHGTLNYTKVGMARPVDPEQLVLRVALQDLSQPKSEDSPPDGVLAVPLLRHQRIALSWMVKKETAINCSGGILADDQGLGKTVSTIALILKERPPSSGSCQQFVKPDNIQNLDSDSDDDNIKEVKLNIGKPVSNVPEVILVETLEKNINAPGQGNGRPAAGTLVVCPTSVLRQWADELQSKVSDAARLSVLVYHGGSRTKDPLDLTKYDVVLTTYSIVSLEVPKQPLVDKDGDGKGKVEDLEPPPLGILTSTGKENSTAKKKKSKHGKIADALMESVAGPLAKVGWFRVVLDEAQSIKNHKTQVARACWGLRAKRRWCLSGTPIQNAIDDLYSYFRFLRYEPYAVYKTFICKVKAPIQNNPSRGYRKLQAILKTIMLRRTKGTILDGEPIITLPPKSVELRKVEFSEEERDFYLKLEADSRAQFEEYAAAGTVKENYVNILLMLLRLRQACDHPLLVKGSASTSLKSSVEVARKLPREKQLHLLKCLEASLAICSICSDPPEEAVISVCGHVFCNQCVIEHLSGDNGHCAATNCKAKLSTSSVFSRSSLSCALSGDSGMDNSTELMEARCSDVSPSGSSKIKAALQVLQSLANKENNSVVGESNMSPAKGVHDLSNDGNMVVEKTSSDTKKPSGEKAIVFSQWTGMLDLLEACLKDSSIQYRRLDGTMSVLARDKAVKDFNTLPEVTVMIMSLKAASLGLNMVSACHVLLLDLWWNPTTEDQAIDRAHRIGQTRPVKVLRLTVKDTVEDRILALQQKKRVMVASAFGEDESGGQQSRLTFQDLAYLFMA
ncbi:hypothetical protein MLD38_027526 [Melastoma candidum]|uniref:Uncharacterized protein n=1 Tax=Melastoma candidum TaxID=119954 RepID=A0ACB9P589_9MYRT|nr:hypothetical protein MLD38_027526 [Melastoma candidum]